MGRADGDDEDVRRLGAQLRHGEGEGAWRLRAFDVDVRPGMLLLGPIFLAGLSDARPSDAPLVSGLLNASS